MNLRSLMFVLPNLFTVSSIFCGFVAMTLCGGDASAGQLYQAALAIFFGMFFDAFDGRVARLTKTQSMFGQELDSLADVITFGAAPSLLIYRWALHGLGLWGLLVAFSFAACGALRLARFNVLAIRSPHGGGSRFFVGMPIPLAACGMVSMVIAYQHSKGGLLPDSARWPVLMVALFLALLMVSTVRYRTFKDVRFNARTATVLVAMLVTGITVAALTHPAWVLVTFFGLYMLSGLLESAVLLGRHLATRKATSIGAVLDDDDDAIDSEDEAFDEQEVI
jgi:CDP-diacylglycerol---serine O-phosphatidyltransferase